MIINKVFRIAWST